MIALIGQKLEHPSARKHESTEVDNVETGSRNNNQNTLQPTGWFPAPCTITRQAKVLNLSGTAGNRRMHPQSNPLYND
jgi:hypothetical protein